MYFLTQPPYLHPPLALSIYSYRSLQKLSVHIYGPSLIYLLLNLILSCLTCWQKVITLVLYILDYPIYLLCTFICSFYYLLS